MIERSIWDAARSLQLSLFHFHLITAQHLTWRKIWVYSRLLPPQAFTSPQKKIRNAMSGDVVVWVSPLDPRLRNLFLCLFSRSFASPRQRRLSAPRKESTSEEFLK